jgi:hypothetical protein
MENVGKIKTLLLIFYFMALACLGLPKTTLAYDGFGTQINNSWAYEPNASNYLEFEVTNYNSGTSLWFGNSHDYLTNFDNGGYFCGTNGGTIASIWHEGVVANVDFNFPSSFNTVCRYEAGDIKFYVNGNLITSYTSTIIDDGDYSAVYVNSFFSFSSYSFEPPTPTPTPTPTPIQASYTKFFHQECSAMDTVTQGNLIGDISGSSTVPANTNAGVELVLPVNAFSIPENARISNMYWNIFGRAEGGIVPLKFSSLLETSCSLTLFEETTEYLRADSYSYKLATKPFYKSIIDENPFGTQRTCLNNGELALTLSFENDDDDDLYLSDGLFCVDYYDDDEEGSVPIPPIEGTDQYSCQGLEYFPALICEIKGWFIRTIKWLFVPNFETGSYMSVLSETVKTKLTTRSPTGYIFFWLNYDWEAIFTATPQTEDTQFTFNLPIIGDDGNISQNPIQLDFDLKPDEQIEDTVIMIKTWIGYFLIIPFALAIARLAMTTFGITRSMAGLSGDDKVEYNEWQNTHRT